MEEDKSLAKHLLEYENNCIKRFSQLYKKSLKNKKISYLPYLINLNDFYENELCCDKSIVLKELKRMKATFTPPLKNLSLLPTLELLKYATVNFRDLRTKKELDKREDKILYTVKILSKLKNYDLFDYWMPNEKNIDLLSLIFNPAKDIKKYKEYLIERIITNRSFYEISNFLRKTLDPEQLEDIFVIIRDIKKFKSMNSKYIKYISHVYYQNSSKDLSYIEKILKIRKPKKKIADLDTFVLPQHSFIKISLCQNHKKTPITISLDKLQGLLKKDKAYKKFWKQYGCIDDQGNYITNINLTKRL